MQFLLLKWSEILLCANLEILIRLLWFAESWPCFRKEDSKFEPLCHNIQMGPTIASFNHISSLSYGDSDWTISSVLMRQSSSNNLTTICRWPSFRTTWIDRIWWWVYKRSGFTTKTTYEMSQLVGHNQSNILLAKNGVQIFWIKQQSLPETNETPMLHGTTWELWEPNQILKQRTMQIKTQICIDKQRSSYRFWVELHHLYRNKRSQSNPRFSWQHPARNLLAW